MKALFPLLFALGAAACDAQAPEEGVQVRPMVQAAPARPLPPLTGRVVDQAQILTAEAEAKLVARLGALEEATTDQLVVLTLPDLDGESIEKAGLRIGNGWGIGHKGVDNGVLLIVAPAERRARIEVGKGLEGLLTNEAAQRIMDRQLVPSFGKGAYPEGIEAGVAAIDAVLRSDTRRPRPKAGAGE